MRPALVLLALLLTALPAEAQFGTPRRASAPPRAELWVVVPRAGFDLEFQEGIVGLMTRVPTRLIPGVAVQAAGDVTFLRNATERQLSLDLVYDFGGLRLGGGAVFRNSYWGQQLDQRETRSGYSLVLGVGGNPGPRSVLAAEIELRWVSVEGFTPMPLTLGLSVAPSRFF